MFNKVLKLCGNRCANDTCLSVYRLVLTHTVSLFSKTNKAEVKKAVSQWSLFHSLLTTKNKKEEAEFIFFTSLMVEGIK